MLHSVETIAVFELVYSYFVAVIALFVLDYVLSNYVVCSVGYFVLIALQYVNVAHLMLSVLLLCFLCLICIWADSMFLGCVFYCMFNLLM